MIKTKSEREIQLMREAGRISALALKTVGENIKPGVSTLTLDRIAEKVIRENMGVPSFKDYNGYPASICASINHVLVHGIPDKTVLKNGDIISIDVGASYKGYHGDNAWTFAVGDITESAQRLLDVTRESLFIGLALAKPGNYLSDISHAIGDYVYSHGFTVPLEYTGHGIGRDLHEDPAIPNQGQPGHGVILKEGMTLAIEPMVHAGKPFTKVLSDSWTVITKDKSLCAHYEHTVLITKDGYEILTKVKKEDD
ncbi:MAG: type I methionyl aminopeptidase [Erysipelotrichaceae bacterium]|nr:type I methionyl aminopeptidase [Erysipelotrichaceae bacterium]